MRYFKPIHCESNQPLKSRKHSSNNGFPKLKELVLMYAKLRFTNCINKAESGHISKSSYQRNMQKYFITLLTILLSSAASADTLRLNSGESLEGKIRLMDEKTLFLESKLTSQELKIDRADLNIIEFDSSARSFARRVGFGIFYRPNGNEENLSVKNWLSSDDSAELLVGYNSGSQDTFGVELRYSKVFMVEGTNDLYYGAGLGIISKNSDRGTALRFFSGNEFFPRGSPNLGISIELGVLSQQGISNASQGFYNAFAARYYF